MTRSKASTAKLSALLFGSSTPPTITNQLVGRALSDSSPRPRAARTCRLTDEEIALYDALAENESASQVMNEPALRVIASELVAKVLQQAEALSADWAA